MTTKAEATKGRTNTLAMKILGKVHIKRNYQWSKKATH
jgi:hypothetical protein